MSRRWPLSSFLRITQLTGLGFACGLAVALTTPLGLAALAPTPYDSDPIEDAPEAVAITVLSVGLKEKRRAVEPGGTSVLYDVAIKARVTKVVRSASGLVPGAVIPIRYESWKHTEPVMGPAELFVLKKGESWYAYLSRDGSEYSPAAGAASFSSRPPPSPIDAWEFGIGHDRASRPRPENMRESDLRKTHYIWKGPGGLVKLDIPKSWKRVTNSSVPGLILVAGDENSSALVNVFHYPEALTPAAGMRAAQAALQESGSTVEVKTQKQSGDDMVFEGETTDRDGSRARWIGTFRQTRKGAVGVFAGAAADRFEANRQVIRDAYRNAWIADGPEQ